MTHSPTPARRPGTWRLVGVTLTTLLVVMSSGGQAWAETYQRVSGSGSTWSENALTSWIANVKQYGMTIDYAGGGSSQGRQQFKNGIVDFAVSEIPYGLQDGVSFDPLPGRKFAYMPIVAGGTAFMYNLTIGGKRVTQLRLSGATIARIFTGVITQWNDQAIAAENPGLRLPARSITPVVRSDGSGTTAQFTAWMMAKQRDIYGQFCAKAGRNPCTQTSNYPLVGSMVAKSGSEGVSGFVRQPQNEGSITYVEYSYARNAQFPVAKLLNDAGYYTLPTAQNVAVGLLGATIDTNQANPATYLTQNLSGVYSSRDARAYPLSSYSYMILPTALESNFTAEKGKTLSTFAYYFLCAGQQIADSRGYSPLPMNLVQAGLDQVKRIPGVNPQNINLAGCNNPTFSPSGQNTLALNAPQPKACDKAGPAQCDTSATGAGTGGGAAPGGSGTNPGANPGAGAGGSARNPNTGAGTTRGPTGPAGAAGGHQGAGGPGAPDPGVAVDTAPGGIGGAVDPDTGEVLAETSVDGSRPQAMAMSVAVGEASGWQPQHTLMALSALALLMIVVGPPVLMRATGRNSR